MTMGLCFTPSTTLSTRSRARNACTAIVLLLFFTVSGAAALPMAGAVGLPGRNSTAAPPAPVLHRHLHRRLSLRGGSAVVTTASDFAGPIETFIRTIKEARRHLVAAAVARSVSIFGMYPIDTFKTRLQMKQANPLRLAGIYRGVSGSLFGQVPYGVLTFGSYEVYKDNLLKKFPGIKPVFLYALAAIMGDVTGSGWLCPSEVVKQQMQAGMYSSTMEAISGIWNKRGLGGFYQGYLGGLARDVPFRVAQLTSYELTKNLYLRVKDRRVKMATEKADAASGSKKGKISSVVNMDEPLELSSVDAACCGALAGSFSAAITSPLDRIKTLLMTDSSAYGGTVASCAAKIWREEGIAGFCAGMVPRVTYIAPSVVIFFIAYEHVQQRMKTASSNTSNQ